MRTIKPFISICKRHFLEKCLLLGILIVCTTDIFGQFNWEKDSVFVSGKIFLINKVYENTYVLHNSNNTLKNTQSDFYKYCERLAGDDIVFISDEAMKEILCRVFGKKRLEELLPETALHIRFIINNSGRVPEVEFLITPQKALISPEELSKIEDLVKEEISFRINCKGDWNYFSLVKIFRYREALQMSN